MFGRLCDDEGSVSDASSAILPRPVYKPCIQAIPWFLLRTFRNRTTALNATHHLFAHVCVVYNAFVWSSVGSLRPTDAMRTSGRGFQTRFRRMWREEWVILDSTWEVDLGRIRTISEDSRPNPRAFLYRTWTKTSRWTGNRRHGGGEKERTRRGSPTLVQEEGMHPLHLGLRSDASCTCPYTNASMSHATMGAWQPMLLEERMSFNLVDTYDKRHDRPHDKLPDENCDLTQIQWGTSKKTLPVTYWEKIAKGIFALLLGLDSQEESRL